MPYTPDEYEKLKAAYKEELRHRKAVRETAHRNYLRQKAEWHLNQMQSALEALGYGQEPSPPASDSTTSQHQVHEQAPLYPLEPDPPAETKTLF